MGWFYDYVQVFEPCLTWEFCSGDGCGKSTVAMWTKGKEAGIATPCPICGERNYTMAVFATTN